MRDFRELKVWQKAHRLTLAVYQITSGFSWEELYGLTSQLRRASSSISANLAEGCERKGVAEFARYCSIAMGSASELEYHLLLARALMCHFEFIQQLHSLWPQTPQRRCRH
jgi:four helix bundle protein